MSLKALIESQYQIVFFRLTLDNLKLIDIYEFLIEYPKIHKIIISEEESKNNKIHYHILMMTTDSNQKNAKQNIKNYLIKKYTLEGNEDHAFSEFKKGTEKRLASYVVKDGKFLYKGFSNDEIQIFAKLSYKKYDPKAFMLEREELIENYLKNTELDEADEHRKLCRDYAALKTKYRQRHTMSTMESELRLIEDIKYPGTTGDELHERIYLRRIHAR